MRSNGLWFILIGFLIYVFFFAPPIQADTFAPIFTLLSGKIPLINPIHISIFSMVGIFLLMYACVMLPDGRMQRLPAWPFLIAGIGTGIVGLIPYLALREPNQEFRGEKDNFLKIFDSKLAGFIFSFSTFVFLSFALIWGDRNNFIEEFLTNKFIHAMTIAVCLFALLFPYPTLLADDMARRGIPNDRFLKTIVVIPLFGALIYLCIRPPLPEPD
ncbi:hypothetical protein [Microcoleus sp. FACHB-1515]|uniref:hypothetical protein n=1 Tax=Cyanophyceae TaxID=3028117 RepID=UPI0018F01C5F|nr:hypothetical protein [Microcoleus sp. FACHB-1515]